MAVVQIVFIGVGGWISEPYLGHTSILIKSNEDVILIDAGEGVYRALRCCGFDVENLNAIVITHRHGDHILGLPTITLMAMHKGINKIKVITHKDVANSITMLFKAVGIEFALDTIEFTLVKPGDILRMDSFTLNFAEAIHTVPSIFVKIYAENKCIVFSGDTKYNPSVVEFIRGCDVLIHEVSNYSQNAGEYGHSNYVEAMDIASKANIKIFIPIHFYQKPLPIDIAHLSHKPKVFIPFPCITLEV